LADDLIAVTYRDRALRFAPCGGKVERLMRANLWYEAELLQYIEALALPGVYIDVGGYVGTHALFFAACCPAERVVTFEPRSQCHQLLRRNIEANDLGGKVELHTIGLADREESVTVRLDHRDETFVCRPLDDVVRGPVSVMKLDVEGMEPRVLAGAQRILRESRPLIFAEANTDAERKAVEAVLAPFGYRLTGRAFNETPTYELAADESRLPRRTSLIDAFPWVTDDAALTVRADAAGLHLRSTLAADGLAHATQNPARLRHAPPEPLLAVSPGSTWFVEATGNASPGLAVVLFLMEYAAGERVAVHKLGLGARSLPRIDLGPRTDRLRVAVRVGGPGELTVDRLALHGPVSPRS
jgi:FkbM family methyltransferase